MKCTIQRDQRSARHHEAKAHERPKHGPANAVPGLAQAIADANTIGWGAFPFEVGQSREPAAKLADQERQAGKKGRRPGSAASLTIQSICTLRRMPASTVAMRRPFGAAHGRSTAPSIRPAR